MTTHQEAIANLRRGPWRDDPNGIPQQRGAGDGQAESTGWLSDNSVSSDVIQTDAVIARHITAGSIETEKIAAGAVTANEIAANTITAGQIAADAITASELAANSVAAENIIANTITASEIAADAITTNELAANAVITENLLAANVTSAKIVATIDGKNYGANSGSAGAPGFFFDAESDNGMYRGGSSQIHFATGGSLALELGTFEINATRPVNPLNDNAVGLGDSTSRWTDVWAVDGSINTSDERMKTDIADSPLGLDFVRSLRPRVYRWRDTADTQAREAASVDHEAMAAATAPREKAIRNIRRGQLRGTISDEEGDAAVERHRAALAEIRDFYRRPVMEAREKRRPGRRLHYGLIAQEVKQALDAAGVDAAFWKSPPGGMQALGYSELIAPLIAAVQELATRLDAVEATRPATPPSE